MAALVAVVGLTATTAGYTIAAGGGGTAGKVIDSTTAQTVSLTALSCPALTGPDLAGQLMAASGFDPEVATATGGSGLAGLTTAQFRQWARGFAP